MSYFISYTILLLVILLVTTYCMAYSIYDNEVKREFRPKSGYVLTCESAPSVPNDNFCLLGSYRNECNKLSCYKGLNDTCDKRKSGSLMLAHRNNGECHPKFICCNGKCTGCHSETAQCNEAMCPPNLSNAIRKKKDSLKNVLRSILYDDYQ